MDMTPKEFYDLLQKTSLSEADKKYVIKLVATMNDSQFKELVEVLKEDTKKAKKILVNAKSEIDQEVVKFNIDLEKIEKESNSK